MKIMSKRETLDFQYLNFYNNLQYVDVDFKVLWLE